MATKSQQTGKLPELKKAIRDGCLARLYIFYGEEAFLRNHYLSQMKKILIDPLTESFNYTKLTEETFSTQQLADIVESLPMMAEHTMVLVDDIDIFKLPELDRTRLTELFLDIPDYCTLVFSYEATAWNPDKRLKKLWAAVEKSAVIVEFARQDQRELIHWVTRHFAANKKTITPELCNYLIDITGGSMTALAGEIAKISAFSSADAICKSDIDAVTEPVIDAVVFQMTNLMGEGKYGSALEKLSQLLKMQEKPISILGAVGKHFRQIATARTLLEGGKSPSDLASLYGISEYAARRIMETARRFSSGFCAKAAEQILETDYGMKTSLDQPERLLELLILELAQEARNG